MLVSKKWLSKYVELKMPDDQLTDRLTMTGLNFDGSELVGADLAINLEVTSNRPDCLGHIGIAREISAVFSIPLTIPEPKLAQSTDSIDLALRVSIDCPQLCSRFTARLIRGIKVGPSPQWLIDSLATIGVATVNNIVDISNYVMFECGQPLHIFDFDRLQGGQILVREPKPGEQLVAIDHKSYSLEPEMCVIADANRAIGLGGVMGGADSEVSNATSNILIEVAHFSPISIRHTARKLNLHSAASYRFERTVDGHNIDWASRRCCQLILDLAGGQLATGVIDVGGKPPAPQPIRLRTAQISRVLGIEISNEDCESILRRLGFGIQANSDSYLVTPPTWRRDATREIDLIEEVGRIHGYDKVPDNVPVAMAASRRRPEDRVVDRIRVFLSAAGFDEAMTASLVPAVWSECFSPWTANEPIVARQPMLGVLEKSSQNIGAVNHLRRSIIPSLLEAFRINEYRSNTDVHLFEIAAVYLAENSGLPNEKTKIGLVTPLGFYQLKGVIASLVQSLNPESILEFQAFEDDLFDANLAGQWTLQGKPLAFLGLVSESGKRLFGFRQSVTVAEIDLELLQKIAVIVPTHREISPYPSIQRDFNFVVDERTRWNDLEGTIRSAGGKLLTELNFKELFRDENKDGKDKKRMLVSVVLQSVDHTLSGAEAEGVCRTIVAECAGKLGARLLA